MWTAMSNEAPSVFVNNSKEGIERVIKGQYAYLMESSSIEYTVERNCELMQIGGLLDSKGYGIGLRKRRSNEYNIKYILVVDSPYTEAITSAILKLQENTELTALKMKWWKSQRGGGQCKGLDSKGSGNHNELGLKNVISSKVPQSCRHSGGRSVCRTRCWYVVSYVSRRR